MPQLLLIPPIDFFNPRSIAVFIGILQATVFAVLLMVRWRRRREQADLWLGALLLVLASSLITPFIGFAGVYDNNQWLTYFPFSISFANGTLIWLYTRGILDPHRRFSRMDAVLFLPALLYVVFRLFLFAHSNEWKNMFETNYGRYVSPSMFLIELAWNLWMLAIAVRLYRRFRVWIDENCSDTERIKFNWLRNFLYVFSAVLVIGAIFDFINSFVVKLSYVQYFYFEIGLALITYYLAIAGYLRSETIGIRFPADETPARDRQTLLDPAGLKALCDRIDSIMKTDRPYLDPQLMLADLARVLGVNNAVLSHAINKGFEKNFNDFVNGYRIEAVKERLASDGRATILSVAFECGFNSKATFNRAFKKVTGRAPRDFADSN